MPRAQCITSKSEEDATTLFVGNLAEEVTEELLYELFLQVGPLASVKIPTDSKGSKCSFGFIRFKHICSLEYAINLLQGISLFKRSINLQRRNKGVNNQRPKPQQEQNRHHNYNEGANSSKQHTMPDPKHIRFDTESNFNKQIEMSANFLQLSNLPGSSRDICWNNESMPYNDRQRGFDDSNRFVNDNQHCNSRDSSNRDRNYQSRYDNRRYRNNDYPHKDNQRGYDDRRENFGGKSHNKQDHSHERKPYNSSSRSRNWH